MTGAAMMGGPGTGLRRFARPAPVLPRIGQRPRDDAERCELCGEVVPADHGHLVEVEKRSLVCACRGCYLLFTSPGAGRGRYRVVPQRFHHDPDRSLTHAEWDELQVPVAMAFFFVNSALDRVVGCYPSPAGATECELDLKAWERLAGTHPLLAAPTPDVEAVLVERDAGAVHSHLLPIDACYALVGQLRSLWSGFDGGEEVRAALAAFRADLRTRSTPLPAEG